MWFILSAVVSAACSIVLTRLVSLAADDFVSFLPEPNRAVQGENLRGNRPESEPQMTFICLFVTGLIFSSFVQPGWMGLSFASGIMGPAAVLLFIGALALGYRGLQWSEYLIGRFYRQSLHSFNFIDRAYAAARRRNN